MTTEYARTEADIRKRVREIRKMHDGKIVRDATEHILNDADWFASTVATLEGDLAAERERSARLRRCVVDLRMNLPAVSWRLRVSDLLEPGDLTDGKTASDLNTTEAQS